MFSCFGNLIAGLLQARAIAEQPRVASGVISHMAWARQQMPLSSAFRAITQVDLNPVVHRCRIGKITLKQSGRAV